VAEGPKNASIIEIIPVTLLMTLNGESGRFIGKRPTEIRLVIQPLPLYGLYASTPEGGGGGDPLLVPLRFGTRAGQGSHSWDEVSNVGVIKELSVFGLRVGKLEEVF